MAENNKRRKVRSESMALDAMHIIIGIAVVVMSVISFLDTETPYGHKASPRRTYFRLK